MDAKETNDYLREKIKNTKDLYLHEEHSLLSGEDTAFVISNVKHRFESVVISTKGVAEHAGDDAAKAKAYIDERFGNAVDAIKSGLKRKGLA